MTRRRRRRVVLPASMSVAAAALLLAIGLMVAGALSGAAVVPIGYLVVVEIFFQPGLNTTAFQVTASLFLLVAGGAAGAGDRWLALGMVLAAGGAAIRAARPDPPVAGDSPAGGADPR